VSVRTVRHGTRIEGKGNTEESDLQQIVGTKPGTYVKSIRE